MKTSNRSIKTPRNLPSRFLRRRSCAVWLLAALLGVFFSGGARAQDSGSTMIVSGSAGTVIDNAGTLQLGVQNLMRTNYTILAAPVFGTNSLAFFTNGVISMGGGQLWNSGNGSLISNGLANGSLLYTNLSVMNHGVLTNMSFVTLNLTGRVLQATTSNVIFNGGNGIVTFNGGTGTITRLILTNASSGAFTFNSGSLITHGSIVSNGLPFIIGDGTNAAVLNLPSGTQTFANGLILSAHATLTNSTTLNTPTLTISGSSLFNMNGGLMVVNVVTNGGAFIQNGGIFDPAFYDNTGTFTLLSGTNQDTVFLNRASGTVNHSGGEHDVSVATNFGAWNISGSAVANLTNFINNGGTLTVSGSGVLNGAVTVGDTGSFNQLFITNGGRVLGDSIVILGNSATSSNNAALVTGPGSLWSNSGNLVVGFNGASNTLMIANGGQVVNASGIIGNNASASNNSVLVTGAGSVWNNSSDLYVGLNGSGNSLTITNGGQVFSAGGIIGNGASATYNNVKVTGAGSVWNNSSDLYVGNYGTSNNLVIANGGKVLNGYGYVGYDGSAGGGGNSVLVTGSGSLWSNAYDVIVGDAAGFGPPNSSGNSLTVTNSGMVLAGGDLYVGYYGSSNTLTIASGGKVLNSYGYVGYDGSYGGGGNSVLVAGPGSLWSNAYDVILGDYLGYGPPNSGGNSLTVTNGGVVLAGGNLYVGYYGSSNTLTIASGGVVMDNIGYVGLNGNLGGGGNSVLVTGSGSLWSNAADVVVGGYNGNGPPNSDRNSLTVTNGGMVLAGGDLYVGMYGSSNTLTISGGGRVFNGNGYIGYDGSFGGGNNSVLVTGSGSLWSNAYDVVVGDADGYGPPNSDRNSLTVTNGGVVLADGGLYVGKFGSSNTLTLANGGQIFSGNGYIGLNASASNNSVLVTGPGSVWSNGTSLFVGASGSGNSLTITNGGQVINPSGYIGLNASASNNSVLVTGPGSAWNNSSDLYVGFAGSSNNLTIANSGTVMATNAVIGNNPSTGNFITVSGGFLYATNGAGTGALDVRNGTLTLNSGTVTADLFYANNDTNSVVNLNGGTLSVGAATVSNSVPFLIGDGVSAAALSLRSGASSFANDLVVRNNATLTIFNTVNVGGNFTQNLGGTLVVGFGGSAPGQYGYLDIAGTASLTGMVQAVGFNGFTPTNGMQLTFLHAAGGWTNGFSSFTNLTTQTALTASLIYPDANDAAVKWNITFTPYALTPNQSAVANVLNMELNNPNMAPLVTYLSGLPTGQLPVAFDSLSPQALTAMSQMGAGMANTQAGNLLAHLGTVLGGGGGGFNGGFSLFDPSGVMDWVNQQPRFASMLPMEQELAMTKETLTSGIMRRSSDNPWGVWAEGAGQFVGVDANQNASGYHVTSAGLTVGLDRQVLDPTIYPHDQLVVGAALGYANSSSYLANNGRVGVNGAQGNVYGLWFKDGWHAEALGGGGANVYDTKRQVLGIDANGNTQGSDLQGMLGGGYDCRVGQWTFGPRASVQYTTVDIDGFTESGSLAPLTIGSQSFDSLLTQMGMHVSHPFAVEKTLWIPDLSLGWQHESMDSVTSVNAQFANGSGNIFSSQGVPLGRDSAVVGLGLTVQWSKNLATYVTYGTELMRNNYSVQNVSAGVRFSF